MNYVNNVDAEWNVVKRAFFYGSSDGCPDVSQHLGSAQAETPGDIIHEHRSLWNTSTEPTRDETRIVLGSLKTTVSLIVSELETHDALH